ncbi:agmatinase [Prosthecomicrobium hirschii]|uniref:Agmatinase n=1 Tax=Prosthecodimorpha hirschii TaxID=665126 RepID=A0A0P6VG63_9HYPH|nr:agmatinase [Prosthecomicrobium hirschii]KPL51015.1 agmatinase [Prosthecomicrobium hirschii]
MAEPTKDPLRPRPTDNAVFGPSLLGGAAEPTYGGVLSFMRRRLTRDLAGVDAVVWGIPFDSAVSNRSGARFGPQAIRRASAIFDGDPQYPFEADPFAALAVVDYGDAVWDYGRPWEAHGLIERQAREILDAGCHLFSLGGDHSVTWPLLKAHAAVYGALGLVMFDAHQDTWPDDGERIDHGSFVLRAVREGVIDPDRSIQVGIRTHAPETCGIEIIHGYELDDIGIFGVIRRIENRVGSGAAYMTFDIDCLDPAFAPGTGTPVAGGLSSREALSILRALGDIGFVGGDVVEVAPAYDHADITAIAASTVAQTYLGVLAETRRGD